MTKWAVKDQAEFEARQSCFDFAIVARAVLEIAVAGKKKASALLARFIKSCRSGWETCIVRKPQQLVLTFETANAP